MKLYNWNRAPNPRRVLIFLAEKGIEVPVVEAGGEGSTLSDDYRGSYSAALVPMLELDDGTRIGEAMAICRYFETLHPDPPLMGTDALDRATVEMWESRAEMQGLVGASEVFRNGHPLFADRGLPGFEEPVPQIEALVARGRQRLAQFYAQFDSQLATSEFIAGARYSVADITALCATDFAQKVCKVLVPDTCRHFLRWHEAVSTRPSAAR